MPDRVWMQRDHHTAIENIDLKQVAVLLPKLSDILQKTGSAKTS
jgi:hypothetical protein